jgi:hypothetical protein
MANELGRLRKRSTSDYLIYERPIRSAKRVLGLPVDGAFHMAFAPVLEGTRVSGHWQVQAQNRLAGALPRMMHPPLTWYPQRELRAWARGAGLRDKTS